MEIRKEMELFNLKKLGKKPNTGVTSLILIPLLAVCTQLPRASAANIDNTSAPPVAATDRQTIDVPPRLQWEANFGYCGEVSLISAGLYYGQYISQYDARAIASRNKNQSREDSQFLLGVNDLYSAAQMHLKTVAWEDTSTSSAKNFLSWIKGNIASGYPVIIGVYYNQHSFEVSDSPSAGDPEFDHIVMVTGVSSKHPLNAPSAYYGDDIVTFSDNGLWSPAGDPDYVYSYSFGSFQANRKQANSKRHSIYSLPSGVRNYGMAITGIVDHDGQTLPIRLSTNVNYEMPAMREDSSIRPLPQELTLTVKVSDLRPGVSYTLYRYDNFKSVPNLAFNANASKALKSWSIKITAGSTFTVKEKIPSDHTAVYRAVPDSAP